MVSLTTSTLNNKENKYPLTPFYQLRATANNGSFLNFDQFKGKKVLLVNTASDCGYTGQYDELEKLYKLFQNKLVILGFPANDFKEQEKGTDEAIAEFCRINYGVTFPLIKKTSVIRGTEQNEVFQWLTNKNKNGWNDQSPTWNFAKYLVNEEGILTNYFAPSVSPLDETVVRAINPDKEHIVAVVDDLLENNNGSSK
jgi:glutathione peroxidase